MAKKEMYSFKIEKELIDKIRKAANSKHISVSAFIRMAVVEKLNTESKLDEIDRRLKKIEKKIKL